MSAIFGGKHFLEFNAFLTQVLIHQKALKFSIQASKIMPGMKLQGQLDFFFNHNGDNTLQLLTATAVTRCIHCPQGNINNHRLESLKISKFQVMHCLRKMVLVSKLLTVHQIHDHHHGITVGKRMFSHLK